MTTVIRAYLQWVDEHQDMIVFWYQETKNLTREFRRRLFDSEHRLADLFKKLINDGCSGDVFCVKDISLMSSNIIIMCDMWAFRRWDLRKAYTLDEYADIQIEGILNSIRKQH